MPKALVVHDLDADTLEKLTFTVESLTGYEPVSSRSLTEAGRAIDGATDLSLVVVDLRKASLQEVESFLQEQKLTETPLIPVLKANEEFPEGYNAIALVTRDDAIGSLEMNLRACLDSGKLRPTLDKEYIRIRTRLLLDVCPLKGDIFIRLGSDKFVKLFHAGDSFESEDWRKYTQQKGIDYLYIHRAQTKEFLQKYHAEVLSGIAEAGSDTKKLLEQGMSIAETLDNVGSTIGFPADVQRLTRTHVGLAVKVMHENPKFSDVLTWMNEQRGEYLPKHSMVAGFIACAIASECEWGSDATYEKLTFASVLHDMGLIRKDMAPFNSTEEAKEAGYMPGDVRDFRLHPSRGAELALTFPETPQGTDQIIAQHHEKPDGSGFPRGMTHAHIAPLASIFIVAHEIAQEIVNLGEVFDLRTWLLGNEHRFNSSKFRKVADACQVLAEKQASLGP
jgi:HD-GYP domain-containing protein (c-di-GMP phosphodiesterase class II)